MDYFKEVLLPDTFKAFLHAIIFNNNAFSLREKQGTLVDHECSSWYERVGYSWCQFGIGEKKFCTWMDQHARPNRTTPFQSMWSKAQSVMTVECEQFLSIFIYWGRGEGNCVIIGISCSISEPAAEPETVDENPSLPPTKSGMWVHDYIDSCQSRCCF